MTSRKGPSPKSVKPGKIDWRKLQFFPPQPTMKELRGRTYWRLVFTQPKKGIKEKKSPTDGGATS